MIPKDSNTGKLLQNFMSGFESSDEEDSEDIQHSSSLSVIDGSFESTWEGIKLVFLLEQDLIFEFLAEKDLFKLGNVNKYFIDMTTKFMIMGPRDLYLMKDGYDSSNAEKVPLDMSNKIETEITENQTEPQNINPIMNSASLLRSSRSSFRISTSRKGKRPSATIKQSVSKGSCSQRGDRNPIVARNRSRNRVKLVEGKKIGRIPRKLPKVLPKGMKIPRILPKGMSTSSLLSQNHGKNLKNKPTFPISFQLFNNISKGSE